MNSFLLESYEDLEISTQIILREALKKLVSTWWTLTSAPVA